MWPRLKKRGRGGRTAELGVEPGVGVGAALTLVAHPRPRPAQRVRVCRRRSGHLPAGIAAREATHRRAHPGGARLRGAQDRLARIRMIGVPRPTDVALLVGFLKHRRDLRVSLDGLEELVHIDGCEPLGKGDVIVGRQVLIAEEEHAVLCPRVGQHGGCIVVELSNIDITHGCTNTFSWRPGRTFPEVAEAHCETRRPASDRRWHVECARRRPDPSKITAAEATRAGFESKEALLTELDSRDEGDIYRITVEYGGVDPRIALRENANLTADDIAELAAKLARLDKVSKRGPWTTTFLNVLDANPHVRAPDLAEGLGLDKPTFKNDVRKLKGLGLTISFSPGYELSPRGKAYLDTL
ncbi:hypothetical protein GQR58_030650 [Nymphon striatum]|nr:hypothetical protein GQR58_030650 [Nymphon striatum]